MFTQPELPYSFDELEPHIDARTMEIHYGKHHAGYVKKLNAALEGCEVEYEHVDTLIADLKALPDDIQTAVRNNGGGHSNHSLFWSVLMPPVPLDQQNHSTALYEAVQRDFGSADALMEAFAKAAATRFGSGWAWLVVREGKLEVCSTANQDSPLMGKDITGCSGVPILCLDVWEHAYYLNYQNRRPDYIEAFWKIVNWTQVGELYEAAV
jgi:Fe-Mn family superoxide dismutase